MNIKNFIITSLFIIGSVFASDFDENGNKTQPTRRILVGESHANAASTEYVYRRMKESTNVFLLIERDEYRLNLAKQEVKILYSQSNEEVKKLFKPFTYDKYTKFLDRINYKLKNEIYRSWKGSSSELNDRIRNRYWIWMTLKNFENRVIPIDASINEVKTHTKESRNSYFSTLLELKPHEAMASGRGLEIRNLLIKNNIDARKRPNKINIVLVGLEHVEYLLNHLPFDEVYRTDGNIERQFANNHPEIKFKVLKNIR